MNQLPHTLDVRLESPIFNNFRCKMACDSLDIDIKKKSIHHLHIEGVDLPAKWNVGLIYGASGSGKTTLIQKYFGDLAFVNAIDPDQPIINQFPKELTYEECSNILTGIGLNSVPCWVRPVKTLSNGQRARAEAALMMTMNKDVVLIDEWTSVVDRTVAKAMSYCIKKYAKKKNKRIILLSCHNDIIEWLLPDWLIDCNEQQFKLPAAENFFFTEREKLVFEIREIGRESWKFFSKYHYLSERLPGGLIHLYGLFHDNKQIGFQCFANYVPYTNKRAKIIYHSNRTVIHPDYQGLGLGISLINKTSALLFNKIDCRIMAKFSSAPVYKAMIKQKEWRFLGQNIKLNKMQYGGNMDRKTGFREFGIKTYNFEYHGHAQNDITPEVVH